MPTSRIQCPSCSSSFHVLPSERARQIACTSCGTVIEIAANARPRPRLHAVNHARIQRDAVPREARWALRLVVVHAAVLIPLSALITRLAGLPTFGADVSTTLHATVPSLLAALLLVCVFTLRKNPLLGWFGLFYGLATGSLLQLRRLFDIRDLEPGAASVATVLRYGFDHALPLAVSIAALFFLTRSAVRSHYGIRLTKQGEALASSRTA